MGWASRGLELRRIFALARRSLSPHTAMTRRLIAVIEQPPHVRSVEHFVSGGREVSTDVSQIEVHAILVRHAIDPVDVADALRLDQCVDRTTTDTERPARRGRPLGLQS